MRPVSKRRARGERAGRSQSERISLYDEITQRFLSELEAGRFPWVQPWSSGAAGAVRPSLPRNAVSGRNYSGVNVLILWGEVIARAYPSQSWLTFAQALDAGGNVRKGEKGVTIVYADRFTPKAEKERAHERGDGHRDRSSVRGTDNPVPKAIPFLKRFTVFNVAQCDGLRDALIGDPAPLPEREMVPVAEELVEASGADFRIGGARAFYSPAQDFVAVPPQPAFFEQINYYRTALHELTHWTGHTSRLARDFSGGFGSAAYAREELVAEMGAAYLCASLGIVPTVRHADYLAGWVAVLRSDNRAIFRAASAATKAADYLLASRDRARADAIAMPVARIAA